MGVILPQPGQLRPDRSNSYGLDALVSNVNTYAVALVDLSQAGTNIVLTGPQMVAGVVRLIGTAAGNFNITLPPTPRIIDALGPTVPLDGSFSVEISVQNEDATFEGILTPGDAKTTINGTAIVAPGTRRIWLLTVGSPFDYTVCSIQNIGTFSTTSVTPGGGTVTSVAQTVPVEFQVTGSPVTSTGTLAISKVNETANTVWAGPTSGRLAQPTFRALVTADLPGGVGLGNGYERRGHGPSRVCDQRQSDHDLGHAGDYQGDGIGESGMGGSDYGRTRAADVPGDRGRRPAGIAQSGADLCHDWQRVGDALEFAPARGGNQYHLHRWRGRVDAHHRLERGQWRRRAIQVHRVDHERHAHHSHGCHGRSS